MITGVVTQSREAIVRVKVHGPQDLEPEIDTILDTGFTEYLTLSQAWVATLALTHVFTDAVTLADGSRIAVDLYECTAVWDGGPRRHRSLPGRDTPDRHVSPLRPLADDGSC